MNIIDHDRNCWTCQHQHVCYALNETQEVLKSFRHVNPTGFAMIFGAIANACLHYVRTQEEKS